MNQPPSNRWLGLDALRGLSIAAMILVNNPGRWGKDWQFGPLRHAEWHGCTFTDLVFPTFLFCAGVAIVPALSKKVERGDSRRSLLPGLLRRVLSLILLGMFLSAFPLITFADGKDLFAPLLRTRFPGVLQRIGVCYGISALLFLFASVRVQRVALAACLLAYWPLITLLAVPDFGPPDIDMPMGTLQGYVDRAVFGSHIWLKGQYDPEGLLSTIPAVASCLLGVEAGRILRRTNAPASKARALFGFGLVLLLVGALWDLLLPFNKYLWTSSYAVWTAGIATVSLAALVSVFEVAAVLRPGLLRLAYPLRVYGQNALLVFVGSGLLGRITGSLIRFEVGGREVSLKTWFFENALLPVADPKLASLLFAGLWVGVWFLVLRWLYRRNLIWRV